jgi:uncharacterized protein (TIGR00730 family)
VSNVVHPLRRAAVFCGSSHGNNPAYETAAQTVGRELARRRIELVYGGGKVGLMGALADAALQDGGRVIGVIPEALMAREVGHRGLSDLRLVKTMHERKALMADLADGFIALPGGMGTFEEFFEIITWAQLGLHAKPCGVLNVNGFFDPLLRLVDHAIAEGFVPASHRDILVVDSAIASLLERMERQHVPPQPKWITKTTI